MKYFVGVLQALSTGASAGVAAYAGHSANAVVVLTFLMITCASVANVFTESPGQGRGNGEQGRVGAGDGEADAASTVAPVTPVIVPGSTAGNGVTPGGQANGGA